MIRSELLPHYSVADYRLWEGDWELVEGIPYAMVPSPTVTHQRTALKIARQLDELLESCDSCQVLHETDWIVADDTVVRPDVMVVCGDITGDYPTQPPPLIFEIISPSTAVKDEQLKFELYQREGVRWYVLVYPDGRKARIFRFEERRTVEERDVSLDRQRFEPEDDCHFEFDFGRIWP